MIANKKITQRKNNDSGEIKEEKIIPEERVKDVISVEKPPVLSSHTRIQTAEGWKRSQMKLLKSKQKKT
ncbi:MAG: hypothetical protein H0V82_08070 [Candidatus Protochlamydia sp.]|nr:hypothetical protein [Candidatus Protochlamydia sp.]